MEEQFSIWIGLGSLFITIIINTLAILRSNRKRRITLENRLTKIETMLTILLRGANIPVRHNDNFETEIPDKHIPDDLVIMNMVRRETDKQKTSVMHKFNKIRKFKWW